MKLLKRIALSLLVLVGLIYVIVIWMLSGRVLFPVSSLDKTKASIEKWWGTTYEESMRAMPPFSDFEVTTEDGFQLKGKYFQVSDSSNCAIVFAHGWGATWADMLKYVPAFSDCNCDYVLYDHRVHGESEGKYATGGINEAKDLWLITRWVSETKDFPLKNIGWMGSSWGGATSIIAGAASENVGFIVSDASYQDWFSAIFERAIVDYGNGIKLLTSGVMSTVNFRAGVDYEEASPVNKISQVQEPVLLIHSMADSETASKQGVNIAKNLNPSNSRFHHTEWGNDHVMDVVNNTEEFRALVNSFLTDEAPRFLKSKQLALPSSE